MFKKNAIPKISLLILLFGFGYLTLLTLIGDSRMSDFGLSGDEMFFPEMLLTLVIPLGIFATCGIAMYRAHLAGSLIWFVASFFFFPAAYLYTLAFNTGPEA